MDPRFPATRLSGNGHALTPTTVRTADAAWPEPAVWPTHPCQCHANDLHRTGNVREHIRYRYTHMCIAPSTHIEYGYIYTYT